MKMKDVAILAGVVGAGVLVLSKWNDIKGLFGGLGDILGGAPGTGAPGLSSPVFTGVDVPVITPGTEPPPPSEVHIPSFVELVGLGPIEPTPIVLPEIDPTAQPPSFLELLNPLSRTPPPETYTPPPTYTPTPSPPTYSHPISTPTPVFQPSPFVPPDPGHPASDPFLGGR